MLYFKSLAEFDFHHELAASSGPVLVMFGAPGCGTCRKVEKLLPEAVAGMVSGLYKVDVQQSMGLARAYEVFHLPALFLFVDGRYHAPIESEVTAMKMKQALEQALAAPPQDEP
ncbi:MAG: thioredoxin family protein [Sulfurimicrobium sp.]|nr:thioredoxin family protein [Sulfurimicrobium sp.]MDP1705113.1 thioredoxin family protein [Sulfurimicrobium sp.]MDP2197279.1 thioredoxin family protein [Sulfurimicrobium sp.]MDP3687816.1 thioredoxin family protein [Sulfurimicrobium sp.]MDZ7655859.1 thioredoxin family protein [Sulfurimicrobium sp.]